MELTYGNFIVIYALSPSLMTIYLLQGYPRLAPPAIGSPADQKAAADWLKTLRNGGIFAVGKKLTEFLWELVKNGLD